MNVPDADAAVEDNLIYFYNCRIILVNLYKTATGSYIADTADLAVGDYADEPTLLIKQTVSRGKTTAPVYMTLNIPQLVLWLMLRVVVVCTIKTQILTLVSGLEITLVMMEYSRKPD